MNITRHFTNTLRLLAASLLIGSACIAKPLNNKPASDSPAKKKALILVSKGGHCHMMTANIIKDALSDTFDTVMVNPYEVSIMPTDSVKWLSFGYCDGEDFYNALLSNGWIRTINLMAYHLMPSVMHLARHYMQRNMEELLEKEKPDLLISVIHYINYAASKAAEKYKIPFLVTTLDMDLRMWLQDFELSTHPNCIITVPEQSPGLMKQIKKKKIPTTMIHTAGFPLKKEFRVTRDAKTQERIRHEWSLPDNKPIIMLMRGGAGSYNLIDYAKKIMSLDQPAHLLIMAGKNEGLKEKIAQLKPSTNVSFTAVPFTDKVADLMAVSSLLVTAPSPGTCNEAMHSGLPMLIDRSCESVIWEKANLNDFILKHGQAKIFRSNRELKRLVAEHLKQPVERYTVDLPRFDTEIRDVIVPLLFKQQLEQQNDAAIQDAHAAPVA